MKKLLLICVISLLTPAAQALVLVDFDAATGPANVVGDITVILDIAADGTATLNSITGSGAYQPAVVISGSTAVAPGAAYQMTLFIATNNGRQTGIGYVGVGNNHIDPGETMYFSLNVDNAPVGTVFRTTQMDLVSDQVGGASGTMVGGTSGTQAFTITAQNTRQGFDATGINTTVAQGSGLKSTINLQGGSSSRYQLAAISLDVVPEPATLVLLGLGGLMALRRRRA